MPEPLPAPTPDSDSSSLADQMMANLTAAPAAPSPAPAPSAPPEPPKADPKPSEPPKPAVVAPKEPPKAPEPAKPAVVPAKLSAAPAPKPDDFDDPKLTAPDLRKRLKELSQQLNTTKQEKETALSQVNARIQELSAKRVWTDEDQKRFDELAKGKEQIERQLYSKNYADSPEYKKLYVDKLNNQATDAINTITQLTVNVDDENTRQGTQADMLRLYNAPAHERRKIAKALFPDDYQEALDAIAPMLETNRLAKIAIDEKRENYEKDLQQREVENRTQNEQFNTGLRSASESLMKSKPEIFGEPSDPTEKTLYANGFKFIDETSAKSGQLPVHDRAARTALIRSMAAVFPVLIHRLESVKAQNAALEAELAPFKRSDPGNAGDNGGGSPPAADAGMNTDRMAAVFDV